jgi:hypothetical protein
MIALTSCGNGVLDQCVKVSIQPYEPFNMTVSDAEQSVLEMWRDSWILTHDKGDDRSVKIDIYDNPCQLNIEFGYVKYRQDYGTPDWETLFIQKGFMNYEPIKPLHEIRVPSLVA